MLFQVRRLIMISIIHDRISSLDGIPATSIVVSALDSTTQQTVSCCCS
jgi:hypothetical protein